MLEDCDNNEQRWTTVEAMLKDWLRERRDVLVAYAAAAASLESQQDESHSQSELRRLCQILIDYCSAGHFEIYTALLEEAEAFGDNSLALVRDTIARIGDTTEVILGFEEKYPLPSGQTADYGADMSLLGEILETRFECEDRLIAGLHRVHSTE